jgi:hypothetical protein
MKGIHMEPTGGKMSREKVCGSVTQSSVKVMTTLTLQRCVGDAVGIRLVRQGCQDG